MLPVAMLLLAFACCAPRLASADCPPTGEPADAACIDNEADWRARSRAPGVFYANNFDYPDRKAYLAGAHSFRNADTPDGKHKLELETRINLSGRGASRHNWFASEGPNEAGPSWNYSFDGPGRHTTRTARARLYVQYAMYADPTWVHFDYPNGGIKTHILLNPGQPPFAQGEIVLTRAGTGPWLHGFSVSSSARGWFLKWNSPHFVEGDDTLYTFWDGAPGGEKPKDIDAFERRYGPRRRHPVASDPDYADVPQIEGGRWYVVEVHVDLSGTNSVVKVWFAERGKAPVLLTGSLHTGMHENGDTYRGGFLLNRAEDTRRWVDKDTFVVYDELLVSEQPIAFPGGFALPAPGSDVPLDWPPPNTEMR